MGRVYEARHQQTRERVAIKVLHRDVARDQVAAERFKREYETANEMSHPNIVKVIEFGTTDDGLGFMTMEYLEGEELGHVLRRDGRITTERLVRFVCQAALGLDYAHSFGFIHRDLKPDNIFLCKGEQGDEVRILDFGSVKLQMATGPKLTAFGTTLGSPFYMSPEQAMGKQDVDLRTDVFALAAIVYEGVTGKIAFEAGNVAQILMKIINQEPVPPSQLVTGLPPRIDDVIEKGLRKDKTRRYGSASELAKALCEAFGLTSEVEKWANTPEREVAAAIGGATAPAAKAFGALSVPPPQSSVAAPIVGAAAPAPAAPKAVLAVATERVERTSEATPLPVKNNSVVIGLGVGALLVVSLVVVLLMR